VADIPKSIAPRYGLRGCLAIILILILLKALAKTNNTAENLIKAYATQNSIFLFCLLLLLGIRNVSPKIKQVRYKGRI
jgi:hypothetical protein